MAGSATSKSSSRGAEMAENLLASVYAPPFTGDANRALAVVHGLERAYPGMRLAWEVSPEGRPVALRHRDEWLAAAAERGAFPLLCNGDETYPVMIHGYETPAGLSPGGRPLLSIHAELPLDATTVTAAADVLAGVADGARAWWGVATPRRTAVEIAEQTIHPPSPSHPQVLPPRGLPGLRRPDELPSAELPDRLGWLNYWSVAAAKLIGFPDPARDAALLSRAQRTTAGAWLVRLTEAPLDLANPGHLDALLRTYDRFPAIGGRANV